MPQSSPWSYVSQSTGPAVMYCTKHCRSSSNIHLANMAAWCMTYVTPVIECDINKSKASVSQPMNEKLMLTCNAILR